MKSPATQPTVVSVVKAKVFLVVVVVFGLFLSSSKAAQAATLYWVGADGANASVASNWSTTNPTSCSTGVTPSGAAPTSADALNFDADCDNGATLDSGFTSTVTSVVLNTGYAGTVTMARSLQVTATFTQSGGTFTASNQTLDIDGLFTLNSGATFTASTGITSFAAGFTINGGTFNHNSGTVTFDGAGGTLNCNNVTFNLVTIDTSLGPRTINTTCSLPLGANPTLAGAGTITLNGTMSGSGTLTKTSGTFTMNNAATTLSGFSALSVNLFGVAGATIDLSSYTSFTATSTTTVSSGSLTLSNQANTLAALTVNGGTVTQAAGTLAASGLVTLSSGSLTLASGADLNSGGGLTISGGTFTAPGGTMTLAGALTISGSPTFNANGGTITFDGSTATLSCNNVSFNLVTFNSSGTKTVGTNCNLPLGSNPTATVPTLLLNGTLSGTGTLTVSNNLTLNNSAATLSGFTGVVVGSSFNLQNSASANLSSFSSATFNAVVLTLSAGTLTLPNSTDINGGLTISGGTFNAPTGTMNLAGNLSISGSSIFNANGGAIIFDGGSSNLNCNNAVFNRIYFTMPTSGNPIKTVSSNCSFNLGHNPEIRGGINLFGTLSGSGTIYKSTDYGSFFLSTGGTLNGFSGLISYASITIAGATADFSNYTILDINDDLRLNSGEFIAPTGEMSILAEITHSAGTFSHNGGTVILDGCSQSISGSHTFFNLIKRHRDGCTTLTFGAGTTTTVLNSLTLSGVDNDLLLLRSSVPGSVWYINVPNLRSVSYVDIQDGVNQSTTITALCSVDSGNNTGWLFPPCGGSIFTLVSPQNRHYTRDERPTFSWRPPSGAALFNAAQDYTLIIDNGQGSDFIVEGIPANRPNGSNVFESDKYRVEYLNWDNADLSDNLITLTTKSSSSWNSDFHDGKLTEGIRNWRVKLKDSSNSIYEMNNEIFVDFTPPTTEVSKINTLDYVPAVLTSDTTPTIFGKVTDSLIGTPDDRKVASGPKSITILIEQETLTGYQEMLTDTINLTKSFWVSDGKEIENNTENLSAKFSPFEYTFPKVLNNGTYRITLKPADNVDNSFATQIFQMRVGSYSDVYAVMSDEQKTTLEDRNDELVEKQLTIPDPDEDQVEIEKSLQKHLEQKTEGEQGKSQQEENNQLYVWLGGGVLGVCTTLWFLILWKRRRKKKYEKN